MRFLLAAAFALLFYAVYGGASWLSALRHPPPAPHFAFESAIPFIPETAWIYLTVPLVLALAPFILRTTREIVAFFSPLTLELLTAGLCYLIYPVAPAWPSRAAEDIGAFRLADALNLDYNELPSLHVAFAISAVLVYGRRSNLAVRVLLWVWLVAVAASTLTIHEHHVLDVVTGAALGAIAVAIVQRRAVLDALEIEALCLRELAFFTRRHLRYLLTGCAIWGYSLRRWNATRLLRAGFCLTQHIDDVLDGDRAVPGDPVAYARGLLRGAPGPLAPLSAFVVQELERRGGRAKLDALVEVLIEDRRRMDARLAMSAADLAAHHRKTFRLSLDLTLIAAGSNLRAEDAPELVEALSWCSPVRDLREDLAKGLINIPAEVLAEVPGMPGMTEPNALLAAEPVQAWLRAEHGRAHPGLKPGATHRRPSGTESQEDDAGTAILAAFRRALAAYEKKYRRLHPDLCDAHREAAR